MSSIKRTRRQAERHLDLYENWKSEHANAMRCRDLEDWIQEGLGISKMLHSEYRTFRFGIHVGAIDGDYSEALAGARKLFERWLVTARSGLDEIKLCQREFGTVEHAEKFLRTIALNEQCLIEPEPRLALAVGTRWDELDEDDTAAFEAALSAPVKKTGWTPKAVAGGDASLLK